jgi:hypothetical protein
MVKVWRDETIDLNGGKTLSEARKEKAAKYVTNEERWCIHCNNCESAVRGIKKYSRIYSKGYTQIVLAVIKRDKLTEFTLRDIIKSLKAEDLTDGTMQRHALSILTALGHLTKEFTEVVVEENKKKVTKIKEIYRLNKERIVPACYDEKGDCHKFDWNDAKYTKIYRDVIRVPGWKEL